jgi:hypothetical protein
MESRIRTGKQSSSTVLSPEAEKKYYLEERTPRKDFVIAQRRLPLDFARLNFRTLKLYTDRQFFPG